MLSIRRILIHLFKGIVFLVIAIVLSLTVISYQYISQLYGKLPDIDQLRDIEYQIPLRIYSRQGILLAQFGEKKRTPVSIEQVPKQLINAFIAAEDDDFFTHPGVDFKGLVRAGLQLLLTGKKKQGGSTITMQVTRNFLLTREKTYERKIKEIMLALLIEKEYSKNEILELYLNKIYLGHRSYGIAAAVSTYYNKKLTELNLAQFAMIAGLPKAPSAYNPITNPQRALQRRNYVLRRMYELGYINQRQFNDATSQAISAKLYRNKIKTVAPYITEMVRKKMYERYGDKAYTMGLKVYTTIKYPLQNLAVQSLRSALYHYDQRHGYRSLPHPNKPFFAKSDYIKVADIQSAHVIDVQEKKASAALQDGSVIELPFANIKWARRFKSRNYLGPRLKSVKDVLKVNDLIQVRQLTDGSWGLAQIPKAEGAFIALEADTGAILALTGGFDYYHNKFNRVIQSKRQPGSGFKPIIYTTALENGYTAASLINDAPVIIDDPRQETEWRPENYSKKFFGMTPLRTGLRKSRNLISIRLLQDLGINKVIGTALRFGFSPEQLPHSLSLALGSGYATPLQMARVYAVFANGGFLIKPYFIDRVEDFNGKILFQAKPEIACSNCDQNFTNESAYAPRIISPEVNFLMNSLLRDVVQRGTATRAKVLDRRDLAGKTGTTNEQRDAWFNGFSAGITATAWLGFDNAKPLGRNETGGKAALPIWIDFMKTALKDKPEQPLTIPEGITKAYIDPTTGLLAQSGTPGIWEFFRKKYKPTVYSPVKPAVTGEEMEELELF